MFDWQIFYIIGLSSAFAISLILTYSVKKLAIKLKIFDYPRLKRKIHKKPVPLMGGLAIFFSFFIILNFLVVFYPEIFTNIRFKNLLGVFIGALILLIGGLLDDKYDLKAGYQLVFSSLAAITVISFGVGISQVSSPFGGIIDLSQYSFVLFWHNGLPAMISLPADIIAFVWLMVMMNTTKLSDGIDGLVSGLSAIACLFVFFLAGSDKFFQGDVALLAIILTGVFTGFLVFNFNPAKIFLGESGALLAGYLVAVLAIISGSKIVTTVLILGLPILDLLWVFLRRVFWEKKTFAEADKKHLHHRLLAFGLSQKQVVLFFYAIAAIFGLLTLFLQSFGKLVAIGLLLAFMVSLAGFLVFFINYKYGGQKENIQ